MISCRVASGRSTGKSLNCCPAHWTTSWSSHTQRSGQPAVRAGDGATSITKTKRNTSRDNPTVTSTDCALGSGRTRMIPPPASSTVRALAHSSLICGIRFARYCWPVTCRCCSWDPLASLLNSEGDRAWRVFGPLWRSPWAHSLRCWFRVLEIVCCPFCLVQVWTIELICLTSP